MLHIGIWSFFFVQRQLHFGANQLKFLA